MKMIRSLYGSWYSAAELEQCVDHVRLSWAESRHNPNFSRFDAVNNKYEQYAETCINIRQIQPPLVPSRLYEKWMYTQKEKAKENQEKS
jgi:hypothetical protein